jgi:predicted metalloprotease with PDZ domain
LLDLRRHLFGIECRIEGAEGPQDFVFSSWTPGSYLLREFARYVRSARAYSGGEIEVEKIDHSTWRCLPRELELRFTAEVYGLDQSVRGAYLDTSRAYFNGACVFPVPRGREQEPVELTIEAPSATGTAAWRVATAMPAARIDARGFGVYSAANYDELIDHPVEIGEFASAAFAAAGVPHELVIAGRHATNLQRVADDLSRLCEAQIDLFGRPPPFQKYWFLGLAVGDGYGGLEHRASSSLIFSRDDLPPVAETGMPSAYQRFLGLASHEYFHTWNIKRIKPAAFSPYRLNERNHTRTLWVFEGITSYYQDLMLRRSGLIDVEAYLTLLGASLTRVFRVPGRASQTLAESSFDAWDGLYKPEAHSINSGISYYTKGALIALALDLKLRRDSEGELSLDSIMRDFWRRYAVQGVPEDGFETLVVERAGASFVAFFDAAVRGVADPPLADLLSAVGVELHMRASLGPEDKGGTEGPIEGRRPLGLGAGVRGVDGGLELLQVLDGGPAQQAGLQPKDVLVALDGLRVGEKNFKARLDRFSPGQTVVVTFFRGDELLSCPLELRSAPPDTCFLRIARDASSAAVSLREAWLGA